MAWRKSYNSEKKRKQDQAEYSSAVLFNLFRYSAPLKMFWRTHAPYLLKHLNPCTPFTDTFLVPPT